MTHLYTVLREFFSGPAWNIFLGVALCEPSGDPKGVAALLGYSIAMRKCLKLNESYFTQDSLSDVMSGKSGQILRKSLKVRRSTLQEIDTAPSP